VDHCDISSKPILQTSTFIAYEDLLRKVDTDLSYEPRSPCGERVARQPTARNPSAEPAKKRQQVRPVRSRQRVHLSRVEGRSLPRLLSMISRPSRHQHFCIEASRIVYVRENSRKISRLAVASRLRAQWSRGRVSCATTPPPQSHFEPRESPVRKKIPKLMLFVKTNALRILSGTG